MKARKRDVFESKINGRTYLVENVAVDGSVRIIEQVEDEAPEILEVTQEVLDNFFLFKGNDTPVPAPKDGEFVIEEGRFLHNGSPVQIGTLIPVEVVAGIPGNVLLTVKSRSDGYLDLFQYNIERDRFETILVSHADYKIIFNDDSCWGVLVTDKKEFELPAKEGEEPEKRAGIRQRVTFFSGGIPVCNDGNIEKDGTLLGNLWHTHVEEDESKKRTVLLYAGEESVTELEDKNGKTFYSLSPEKDGARTIVREYTVDVTSVEEEDEYGSCCVGIRKVSFDGILKKVQPVYDGNYVFVTDDGIVYSNFGHGKRIAKGRDVLKAVDEFPYLISTKIGDRINVFTFGNEEYRTCEIKVEKTSDRGYVTTVTRK